MLLILLGKKRILIKTGLIASQLEEWLMDVILENNSEINHVFLIPREIKLLLQSKFARSILLGELITLKKSLSGNSGDNLEKIYNQLNLKEISLKRLTSKLWHVKAKGIQELAIMNQHSNNAIILELTNHQDHMVRMEAQTALVRLRGYKGLQFFDNLTYPLSEWHQLNLLSLLAHQPITGENGIFNWLHSSNVSVLQFSLKLIGEQHAMEFHEEVVKCLSHPNEIVRREAILCLAQMPSNAAAEELNRQFTVEPEKNLRVCIINEFRRTGSDLDLPFLQTLQHDEDVDIKLAANKTVLYLQKVF
ncbi:MAG: HEAT repeat domain-containing protein [Ferruginibacter sp.]